MVQAGGEQNPCRESNEQSQLLIAQFFVEQRNAAAKDGCFGGKE